MMRSESSKKLADPHHSMLVLDSQFEAFFDSITCLTSKLCHSRVALVTFVEEDSIWVQSQMGFPDTKMLPNRKRFCRIFPQDNNYFEISDMDLEKTHDNHLFYIEDQEAKFCAGACIKLPLGEMLGVLCVFDTKPRRLTVMQRTYLVGMAAVIEKALITKHYFKRLS